MQGLSFLGNAYMFIYIYIYIMLPFTLLYSYFSEAHFIGVVS